MSKITPYNTTDSKKEQVAEMFDNIAFRYDFLNGLLSFGIHKGWRRKCVKKLKALQPKQILDVATGTGDFAIACTKLNPTKIIGIDISEGMMKFGREKLKKLNLDKLIELKQGDAETIDFADNSFEAIVVGFGVRNFENLEKGLLNLNRVLKPGGKIVILEFSYPRKFPVKQLYTFYFSVVTPFIGKIFSKDTRAYTYLPESVKAFPNNEDFTAVLTKCGFKSASFQTLSFGVAAIYEAVK
ncbi:MAG TPA: bifunctional demethylmenaquinone methyltransferase/2-methoxy-6-polyprenyl-1,4-benzoquinol methylase UbiE [Bacteroidia bacterium]|jgi:demethylmenaquinone methyltransferase/2-methoxy-6-polyprenyl-1,4-benzoquinol methylase|nr:bifunctional demethylmenaquinone methyltransferase/2-methoxy-6-polyprenyl-1,4-benzoquinol methylase UbiE [Bacteroidia bacterium]